MTAAFFLSSALLGVGLAMDAFSVSVAEGIADPRMKRRRAALVAGTFAFFQFAMPMIGWFCVHSLTRIFTTLQRFTPYIALALLAYIGGKMIAEGLGRGEEAEAKAMSTAELLLLGVATSIDALSVGFTIAAYSAREAFLCSLIIAMVTYVICALGLRLGRQVGLRFARRAGVLGGAILIVIGLRIALLALFAA